MFDIAKLGDMNQPLTPEILQNPDHNITKHLIYIYTMESFLYPELNKACRNKDKVMIKYFGPFASAFGFIIHSANQNCKDRLDG